MKASYTRPEQRRDMRSDFPAGQLFIVDLISRSHALRTFGIVLNISKGGMAVQTFSPLPAGHIAEIRHCFSKTPLYTGAGLVVWKKEGGLAGLRFMNGRLKSLPELCHSELDGAPQGPDSALPLHALRSNAGTNAFDSTLHLLACSAMTLTDAAGVAIVLGNSQAMECRASAGIAPEVGTQLRPDSGLSGHSLRTGSVILCGDAWSDARVNMAAAQQMDTRSILILPITMAGSVVGLIEAFSPATNHFDQRHVERLQPLVTVLASVPELETAPPGESSEKPPVLMPAVAAGETVAVQGPAQIVEPEEPAISAPAAAVNGIELEEPAASTPATAEIAEEPAEAVPATIGIAPTEPVETANVALSEANRSRALPLAVVAGLLIVLTAMVVLTYRYQAKTLEIRNATRNSLPSNGQGAVAAAKPEISLDPPVINQNAEATFGVNIVLKNAGNILSAPMQIHYDPQTLQVVSIASGGLFDSTGQPGTLDRRVDSAAGTIDLTLSRPSSLPGAAANGSLVTMTFRSKIPGHSQLQVSPVELRDSSSHVTFVKGAEALVEVLPSPTKAENTPAKPAIAKQDLQTKPTAPAAKSAAPTAKSAASAAKSTAQPAKSAQQIAPPAAHPPLDSKAAPEATLKASAGGAPESPSPEPPKADSGALVMQGVPPGSEVWLDNEPFTATAQNGKVAIQNIPAGTHHLRMSLHNYQYYDQLIDLKPGEVVKVEPHTGGI